MIRHPFRRLGYVLFPRRCCLCGEVIRPDEHLCATCRSDAPFVYPPICTLCGRAEDRCSCGGRKRHFARCVTPFYYERQAHAGIGQVKRHGDVDAVEGFAVEMAELVRREYGGIPFDCVTQVPEHPKDTRLLEFEHAKLLARELAEQIGVPYRPLLRKLFRTVPQKELPAAKREGNLLGAFDVTDPEWVQGKTVLLVDDVITTGSTLDECAKMLKIYGADEVYAITAACAVLKKDENDV